MKPIPTRLNPVLGGLFIAAPLDFTAPALEAMDSGRRRGNFALQ
jgi:hypothetical protein